MSLLRVLALLCLSVLVACSTPAQVEAPARKSEPIAKPLTLNRFAPRPQPKGVARSNREIAQDFLDLTFALETGKTLDQLLKFDGTIEVMLYGTLRQNFRPELTNLISRLRREAGVPILETSRPGDAEIHVHAITKRDIRRIFPGAACFIVPGVSSWDEFRNRGRLGLETRWSALQRLSVISVFLPVDSAPQDIRDCLHEEIAQALGPANDLYRLADSIFNDDNFHSVLTPFDMLILRTLYSPEIRAGMTRNEVAAVLPGLLNRLNPKGRGTGSRPRTTQDGLWKATIEKALNSRKPPRSRRANATRAVALAREMQPTDHRLGMSLLALGRIDYKVNNGGASAFAESYLLHNTRFGKTDIRTAHSAVHIAVTALREEDYDRALQLANDHIDTARKAENAVVLSSLLAIRSEALFAQRKIALARNARLESLAWARYAYGDADGKIAQSERQLAALDLDLPSKSEPAQ